MTGTNALPRKRRRFRAAFSLICLVVAGAAGYFLLARPSALIVVHRLEQLADAQVSAEVRSLAEDAEGNLPVLVLALGSRRESLSHAAREVLASEVDRWELLSRRVRTARQQLLVDQLAAHVADYGPSSRQFAADLALRILTTSSDGSEDLTLACESVLRQTGPDRRSGRSELAASGQNGLNDRESADDGSALAGRNRWEDPDQLSQYPGGGLLPNQLQVAQNPPTGKTNPGEDEPHAISDLADNQNSGSKNEQPRPNMPAYLPQESVDSPRPLPNAAEPARPARKPDDIETKRIRRMAAQAPIPVRDEAQTVALMHQLNSEDDDKAQAAEDELRREGFGDLQLELARRLTDDDPAVRQALAENLPRLPGIDAKTWLTWLSRDPSADVRLTALTVMATTGDPEMVRRVQQMARDDRDPRIQQQVERLTSPRR